MEVIIINKYYAKSNGETIQEHTQCLLDNLAILKEMNYINNYDFRLLEISAKYHDVGKIDPNFQLKVKTNNKLMKTLPHAYISASLLPLSKIKEQNSFDFWDTTILVNSIIFHHDRTIDLDENIEKIEDILKNLRKKGDLYNYSYVELSDKDYNDTLSYYLESRLTKSYISNKLKCKSKEEKLNKLTNIYRKYVLTKGLLHKLDYSSSAHEKIEYKSDFLLDCMDEYKNKYLNGSNWNPLQEFMIENRDKNVVAIAQTGYGKTEAGLLWIGNNKGFFTLPIRVALNDIYSRITNKIVKENIDERVALNHSESYYQYLNQNSTKNNYSSVDEESDIESYYDRTKLLSLPLTLSTLDQLFTFVFKYRGYEHKLSTLSYSKIVIDEIQMYSPEIIAYLIVGLKEIVEMGGKFCIITATFPQFIDDLLKNNNVEYTRSIEYIKEDQVRHKIEIIEEALKIDDFIINTCNKNRKVLIICNTVKEAQRVYEELKLKKLNKSINLIHSYFIKKHRKEKEEKILTLGSRHSVEEGIWVGTQVLEASLDIDFDVLITELSDVNGFFQRLGRVYRNRCFDKEEANVYLFVGNCSNKISGIGSIIDKNIFELSKKALFSGLLTEKEKMSIINKVYTTDNLQSTDYYKKITNIIEYIKQAYDNILKESEAQKHFREIISYSIIPKSIYENNKEKIKNLISIIEDKEKTKKEKKKAQSQLNDHVLSLPIYKYKDNLVEKNEKVGKNILIYDCEYSFETGFLDKKILKKK